MLGGKGRFRDQCGVMPGLGRNHSQEPSPSFPSSHASVAMALGVVGWLSAPHVLERALLLAVGVLISWSRVALGLHFPVDVLIGVLLATVVAWLVVHSWSLGLARLASTRTKAPVALPTDLD